MSGGVPPQPLVATQILRFGDTDRLGHVNNAVYAQLFEAGRVEILQPLGLLDGPHALVLARLEIDFLREMHWPGEVRIETWVGRIGARSVHLRQRLLVGGTETARARSVVAIIDGVTRKSVPIHAGWRATLAQCLIPDDNVP